MPSGRASRLGPAPGADGSLSGGRCRVAAGRTACQRAAHVLRYATALRTPHHFARPWSAFVAHGVPVAGLRIPAAKPVASETRSGASS